ncbi:PIG-L deacetylase family protein [Pseudomonas entomophila]|uniref:PIG-L deacetylase family protein n=1 Tax=Pseudomonas entomophila TaxID=312306 RepID=UPI001F005B3A|nr:PIG-L family deacetylase [Pseudomonas entomophila]MCG8295102.1 PIG-L family deacetylase [Pseudomonas entomophila]
MSSRGEAWLLSPHCDDIAYSMAGRLLGGAERGQGIRLLTIFSQSRFAPYAQRLNTQAQISRWRQAEEARFCAALHLAHECLDLAEAPLRGYPDVDSLFVDDGAVPEDPVLERLEQRLRQRLEQARPARVYAPLGIGGHVDHLLTRRAAQRVFADVCPLLFYEDLPYAGELSADALAQQLTRTTQGLRPLLTPLADWLPEKLRHLAGYASQVAEKDLASVATHAHLIGGERVWTLG